VIPWLSHHPRSMLFNILRNELRRAQNNGSNQERKAKGVEKIKERFLANGYPAHIIDRAILQNDQVKETRPRTKKCFLTLPFLSEKQAREVKASLRRCNLADKLCISFRSTNLASLLRPNKNNYCHFPNCKFCARAERGENCMTKFIIYRVKCVYCSSFYVGESARTIRSRLREHITVNTSHVYRHILTHKSNPCLDDVSWTLLHSGLRHYDTRTAVEASEICSLAPDLNVQWAN